MDYTKQLKDKSLTLLRFCYVWIFMMFFSVQVYAQSKADSLVPQIDLLEKEQTILKEKYNEQTQTILQNRAIISVLIIIIVLFVALLWLIYKRWKFTLINNKELEKIVSQRTINLQQSHQKLEKTISQLAKTNLELDTFLYKASHDLKGPLSTLEGLCNVILLEDNSSTVAGYIQMKKDIIARMKLLLFRIIEIGEIRNHKTQRQSINARRFISKIVRSMHRVEGFKEVEFMIEIGDEVTIETDTEMLEIILDNILKNSIQHNKSHFDKHYVKLLIEETVNHWELYISENGYSIPERVFDKVFNIFFKNSDRTEGFGLGLYKVKIAVEKLKGEIRLSKSNDDETVFMLMLPKD